MAALTVKKLPEGDEWLYELKWDGYRALLIKDGEDVQIRSRNEKDLTAMYPGIATAGRRQKIKQIVLDGELVALGEDGRPSFQALRKRSANRVGAHRVHCGDSVVAKPSHNVFCQPLMSPLSSQTGQYQ